MLAVCVHRQWPTAGAVLLLAQPTVLAVCLVAHTDQGMMVYWVLQTRTFTWEVSGEMADVL